MVLSWLYITQGNELDLNPLFSCMLFALFQSYHVQSLDQAYFLTLVEYHFIHIPNCRIGIAYLSKRDCLHGKINSTD